MEDMDSRPIPDPTALTTIQLEKSIAALKELFEVRFDTMEKQRLEAKADAKASVDAAFLAQKEDAAKTEISITKQLEQLGETFKAEMTNINTNLDDLKSRVGKMEALKSGGQQAYAGIYAALGGIALIITIGLFLFANRTP